MSDRVVKEMFGGRKRNYADRLPADNADQLRESYTTGARLGRYARFLSDPLAPSQDSNPPEPERLKR
jgi:hypothetical protein